MASNPKDSRKQRSDGDGSIYFDAARNRWIGAVVLGYIDNKPIRRKVSATTRSGAATKLRELRERYADQQMPAAGKPITVEKWMLYWLTQIAPRRVRPLTMTSYETKVRHYIVPLLGHHRLDRLTPEHIEAAWDALRATGNPKANDPKPLSPATVRQTHRILSRALKVAVQRKRLRTNPADSNSMDAPTAREKEMSVLNVAQVRAVLEAAKGDRMEARWAVALSLGLRQGEALGLRWEDVDLDDRVLRVRQALQRIKGHGIVFGEPKSAKGKRDIALHAELARMLKAHRKAQTAERLVAGSAWHDSGLVFTQSDGHPIDPSRDSKAWRALIARAGVPAVRLHDARHSAATLMLLSGVQTRVVMDTLGHSQISMTSKYQHAVDQMKRDAADAVGEALWGN